MAAMRETLALRQWVLAADPGNAQARTAVARVHGDLAWMLGRRGDWTEAEAEMRRGLVERERLAAQTKGTPGPTQELTKAIGLLGEMLVAPERPASADREAEACALYRRSERVFAGVRDRLPQRTRGGSKP